VDRYFYINFTPDTEFGYFCRSEQKVFKPVPNINEIEIEVYKLREFGGFERKPPVQVGDVRSVRIEALGSSGDGIAKINGFVVFVPGVKLTSSPP
jgi:predicted RNA-binding protein with TRAM domain